MRDVERIFLNVMMKNFATIVSGKSLTIASKFNILYVYEDPRYAPYMAQWYKLYLHNQGLVNFVG